METEAKDVSESNDQGVGDQPLVHSPGPWEWHDDLLWGGKSGLFDSDGDPVCVPNTSNDGDTGAAWFEDMLSESDAQLIAEAPRLIEALRDIARVDNTPQSDAIKVEVGIDGRNSDSNQRAWNPASRVGIRNSNGVVLSRKKKRNHSKENAETTRYKTLRNSFMLCQVIQSHNGWQNSHEIHEQYNARVGEFCVRSIQRYLWVLWSLGVIERKRAKKTDLVGGSHPWLYRWVGWPEAIH